MPKREFQNILLTGGCGFIGTNFVRFVLEHRPDIRLTNLDALTYSGNAESLRDLDGDSRYRFVHGDIRDRALVDGLVRECDAIMRMAASSEPALRSAFFSCAMLLRSASVTVPTLVRLGSPDPFSILAALMSSFAAGGVLVTKVKERSAYTVISTGITMPFWLWVFAL